MLYFVSFLILLCILLCILLFTKINFTLCGSRMQGKNNLSFEIRGLWGLFKLRYQVGLESPEKKETAEKVDKSQVMESLHQKMDSWKDIYHYIKCELAPHLKRRLKGEEFRLDIVFGTGDAAYTGMLNGVLWGVAGVLLSTMESITGMKKKSIRITPEFQKEIFQVDVFCIIGSRMVHIIKAVFKILLHVRARKKQEKKQRTGGEQDGGTSDTRTYEYGDGKHQRHG